MVLAYQLVAQKLVADKLALAFFSFLKKWT